MRKATLTVTIQRFDSVTACRVTNVNKRHREISTSRVSCGRGSGSVFRGEQATATLRESELVLESVLFVAESSHDRDRKFR